MTRWKNGVQTDMSDYIKREDAMVAYANHEVDIRQGKFDDYHQYMRNVLRSVESADVAPVRHGRWVVIDAEEPRRYGCSECKRLSWHMENYCGNCGARMDGDEDDD